MKVLLVCAFLLTVMVAVCLPGLAAADEEYYPGTDISVPETDEMSEVTHTLMRNALYNVPKAATAETVRREMMRQSTLGGGMRGMQEMIAADPQNRWALLHSRHPALYPLIAFFNPPQLRNLWGNIATILFAFVSAAVLVTVDTDFKFFFWCMAIFCWGRMLTYCLLVLLTWRG